MPEAVVSHHEAVPLGADFKHRKDVRYVSLFLRYMKSLDDWTMLF